MGCFCRSNSLLRSGDLNRNRSELPNDNSLDLGTLLGRNELKSRDWSFDRSSLCSSSRGRSHGLDRGIHPIKETLHRCASNSRNLFTCEVINRDGLKINLRKERQGRKGDKQACKNKKKKRKKKERRETVYDNM